LCAASLHAVLRAPTAEAKDKSQGVAVAYTLPTDRPLPKTYRVSLSITDAKNPDWIISTFAAGVVRTVTAENGGKFSEVWNGLDENFMPVPPGDYGVKGIYMPAEKWSVDGEYHSIVPRFVTGASSFMPPDELKREPFHGDPVHSPLGDVAVSPDGIAVFYYRYLENGKNNPMIDLTTPIGFEQCIAAFPSGGAAGGTSTTTDGKTVWSFSTDGGPKFVYRADGKRFGFVKGNSRPDVSYQPAGWVTAMANWVDPETKKTYVYVAERGRIITKDSARHKLYVESETEFVNKITVLDGESGKVLGELDATQPRGLAVNRNHLIILGANGKQSTVESVGIVKGLPFPKLSPLPPVLDAAIDVKGFATDEHGNLYVSDAATNQVLRFGPQLEVTKRFGKGGVQRGGTYDPQILMSPTKIAAWTDKEGHDRLLILEAAGPNRISEWDSDGKMIREWLSLQTYANDGYTIDPENPSDLYLLGQENWLTRFKVDYAAKKWTVDAVWPDVGSDPISPRLHFPRLIRQNGNLYLAGGRSFNVYRLAADRWLLSAALIREQPEKGPAKYFFWHDENGNGKVDREEYEKTPASPPVGSWKYWGQHWLDDLSLAIVPQPGEAVWRMPPSGFDTHGNPIFKEFVKVADEPIFAARREGKADATHGGNELDNSFGSSWSEMDGSAKDGFYVSARGAKGFTANFGAQQKLSYYAPDGKGGYAMKWRVGRAALGDIAAPGEIYGAIHLRAPINGIIPVIDQTRCGLVLYTADGQYIDTLFPDGKRFSHDRVGLYALPGEFFAGDIVPNKANGKIYFAFGKYTPLLFEAVGWSLKENPVKPLTTLPKQVSIDGSQIASPPEIALFFRGGAGAAKLARIMPAVGGAALDGSMTGWETASPNAFQADKDQTVEARVLYDPSHLYVRWHVRLSGKFEPKALQPVERIFTHDRSSDTVSLYLQGDPAAKPGPAIGRPGDVRIVFGLFNDGGKTTPIALGMYPHWPDAASAKPMKYTTPVGTAEFAHVAPVTGAELGYSIDADGKGFVIAAALPASVFPKLPTLQGGLKTFVNFEATLAGHNKFWWANSDGSASRETYDEPTEARLYPGSWAPAQLEGLDKGLVLQNWMILGPFGGPGTEKFNWDGGPSKPETQKFFNAAKYPPDEGTDFKAIYKGPEVHGHWNNVSSVRWTPAKTTELDARVKLGQGAQMWYAATWVYAPQETQVDCSFLTSRMANITFSINGKAIDAGKYANSEQLGVMQAKKRITLAKGWNEIRARGYCYGYPPLHAGVVLDGPAEALWTLRASGTPPEKK
jgi:hypothetical protein